ncbi:hypothetical protein Tco_0033911 [Tanacetum coccineum]
MSLSLSPRNSERGCGYFMWMDASPGPSTPQSHSPGTSSRPSYSPRSAQNLGMTECSNCKFLAERIKTLEARISVLEGQLENGKGISKPHTRVFREIFTISTKREKP